MAAGPITSKFVDSALSFKADAFREAAKSRKDISADTKSTAAMSKLFSSQVKSVNALVAGQADMADSAAKLAALDAKRGLLLRGQQESVRRGNIELQEHYKKQLMIVTEQAQFIAENVKMEVDRKRTLERINTITEKQTGLHKKNLVLTQKDETSLANQSDKLANINKLLASRVDIGRLALRSGKSIEEVETHVLDKLDKQIKYREQLSVQQDDAARAVVARQERIRSAENEHLASIRKNTSIFHKEDNEGLGAKEALLARVAGLSATTIGIGAGFMKFKSILGGVADASDIATEAQYNFGNSLSKQDRSVSNYAARAKDIVSMNSELTLSFANMGLDIDEAKDLVPKMLASSGVALRAFQDRDMEGFGKMAKNAAAFARQTGSSVEDAAQFQNTLMATRGLTADQASDEMNTITGGIRGMNDVLTGAGFKGSLLNVGEFANITKQAAENTESLAFNTGDYAKRIAIAAKNVRLMGVSEREAAKFAAAKGALYTKKNAIIDMRTGQSMVDSLKKEYNKEVEAQDPNELIIKLMADKKLNREQATLTASMLRDKKTPTVMLANRMSTLLKGTEISNDAIDNFLDETLRRTGLKSVDDINRVAQDPIVLSYFNANDIDDATAQSMITKHALDYLARQPGAKFDPKIAALAAQQSAAEDKKAQEAAKAEAGVAGTKEGAGFNITKAKNVASGWMSTVPGGIAQLGAIGAGTLGINYAARRIARGAIPGSMLSKAAGVVGTNPFSILKAFKAGGGSAIKSTESSLLEGVGSSVAKTAEQTAAKTAERGILKSIVSAASHNKLIAGGLLAAGGVAYGANKLFGSDDAASPAPTANQQVLGSNPGKPYIGTLGDNAIGAGTNLSVGLGLNYAGKAVGKLAPGLVGGAGKVAGKVIGESAAKIGGRAIPILGPLISGAMTAYFTEGNWARKASAAVGDVVGTAAGQLATGGIGGGIVGGAAGQFAGTELYDWLAGEDANKVNTNGSLESASKLTPVDQLAQQATNQTGYAAQAPQLVPTGIGSFGTVRSDGSVDVVLNARLSNFAPVVAQANTMNLAQSTQYSGAKNK